MTFPDIVPELKQKLPELRGRLLPNQSLAELTWFRVGGPAQVTVHAGGRSRTSPICSPAYRPTFRSPWSVSAPT